MPYTPFVTSPEQDAILTGLEQRANEHAVFVLDLDGCLFDTRHRQIQILREFASRRDLPELYRVQPKHFVDWSLETTLVLAGLGELVDAWLPNLERYWFERFFDGDYLVHDHAMPGAPALARRLAAAGARLVYLTGRHKEMEAGTARALRAFGFPLDDARHQLWVKPRFETDDTLFKDDAIDRAVGLGEPVGFIDNEPSNVNMFAERLPQALTVWIDTDHSPKRVRPNPALPVIQGFLLQAQVPTQTQ